jgi:hypothetical protein
MDMGHMDQRRQKIRSTSKTAIDDDPTTDTNSGTKTHLVYAVLVHQGQLYTDLTGKFPVRSSKGNSYVMVCYVYEYNYVKVVPMKSRSASEWVKAYDHIHQELTTKGFKQKLQTLNNEASAALKHFFNANDVEYQLVPPHYHRRNAAERAISDISITFVGQTFTPGGTHLKYLADLKTAPTVVRQTHFHGLVDYNKTSFAPPGCKIIAHEKPGKRRTWAPHGQHGYSLGPEMHH